MHRESGASRLRKALSERNDLLDIPLVRQDDGVLVRIILFLKKIIELVSHYRPYSIIIDGDI